MTDVLRPDLVSVRTNHDLVVLKIGNAEISMGYEDAIKLSQWLRIRGKEAKRFSGDVSRHWSAIGIFTQAEP